MPTKVKTIVYICNILGWFYIIASLLAALFFLVLFPDKIIGEMPPIVTIALCLFFIIMGCLLIVTAKGTKKKKTSARTLGIVISIITLFTNVPLGTIIGIVLLVNFFSSETKEWFSAG